MPAQSAGMSTSRSLSLGLIVLGVVLIVLGVIASDSISSDFSRFFTGEPTDKTIWLLLGGGLATLVGLGGLTRG